MVAGARNPAMAAIAVNNLSERRGREQLRANMTEATSPVCGLAIPARTIRIQSSDSHDVSTMPAAAQLIVETRSGTAHLWDATTLAATSLERTILAKQSESRENFAAPAVARWRAVPWSGRPFFFVSISDTRRECSLGPSSVDP